jgi:hypothetical protein
VYRKRDTEFEKRIAGEISEKATETANQARLRIAFPLCSTTRCLLLLLEAASNAVVHRLLTNCFSLFQCSRNLRFCTQIVDRKFHSVASQPESS